MPPWRIQHESHTCSEQSLQILMWNASYVQKQSSYTWQEKVEDQIREGSRRMYFKATARCNISIWTKSEPPWHQVWFENCLKKRRAGSWLGRMPSSKINEIVKMILQAMSTTSMPRSAGTGEWSVHPSPSYHSFVASGRYDGPDAPAFVNWKLRVLHLFRWFTHTHIGTGNASEEREVSNPGSKTNDRKNHGAKKKYLPARHAGIPELHDAALSCNAR